MIALLVLLSSSLSNAGQLGIKYGPGVIHSENSKLLALSYKKQIHNAFYQQYELGSWFDSQPGRSNSTYVNYSLGLNITGSSGLYAEWFFGPLLMSTPDAILGGTFQFNHDLAFGLRDKKGYSVGIDIKHISSAGINLPNLGRDFINISIGIPL